MATRINKFWSTAIVFAVLLMVGLSSAAWTPQGKQRPPDPNREILREAERIRQQMLEQQKAAAQQQQPAAPPATAPEPEPPPTAAQATIQRKAVYHV